MTKKQLAAQSKINQQLATIILNAARKHPHFRFCQLLEGLGFIEPDMDFFYVESERTLKRVKKIRKKNKL